MQLLAAIPGTFFASVFFCWVARWVTNRWKQVRVVALGISLLAFISVVVEIIGLSSFGSMGMHNRFGAAYDVLRTVNFLTAAPAVACTVLCRPNPKASLDRLALAIVLCWIASFASVLCNVIVEDTIYGVDGTGIIATQSGAARSSTKP